MFNNELLISRICLKFGSQSRFAIALGITENTLSRKLTGKSDWKQSEIFECSKLLDIPSDKIYEYFFIKLNKS